MAKDIFHQEVSYAAIQPCEELKGFVSHFWMADWDDTTKPTLSTTLKSLQATAPINSLH